ncbi:hypothetical protein RA29_07660 [Tateyamaria sp. ANG-S1]|nr:hypothetical protein RA29_07660 [Tateyamaria sp. ANG-S1]
MGIERLCKHGDRTCEEAGLYNDAIRIAGARAVCLQGDQVIPTFDERTMPVVTDDPGPLGCAWMGNTDGLTPDWTNATPEHADDIVALVPSWRELVRIDWMKLENWMSNKME